jgi:hypothetical protein
MLADVDRYLAAGQPDPARDGAGYRVGALWLSDAEFAELARDLGEVFGPRLAYAPGKGRKRRMVYTVFLPGPEDAAGKGGDTDESFAKGDASDELRDKERATDDKPGKARPNQATPRRRRTGDAERSPRPRRRRGGT